MEKLTLYRPIGLKELELIQEAGWKAFPPRLSWQPIFYPVLNEEYAAQIAQGWNIGDAFSGYFGAVTKFEVDKSCFSQWWVAPFVVDGICYPTAEHWMMAEKARLFSDEETCTKILAAKSPAEAKKLGRTIRGFDIAAWDTHKFAIVLTGNRHKFSQHQALKDFLLGTGERVLAEASPVDAIWGISMAADHPDIEQPQQWKGENLLGYALMEVRDELRNESTP